MIINDKQQSTNMTADTKTWVSWFSEMSVHYSKKTRGIMYDMTIGYFYTQYVMRYFLETIPDGSRILDIGIGTGYTYSKNKDILKKKSLKVVGVDVDPDYVRSAKHGIIDADLESHVNIILSDIYKVDESMISSKSFDYVVFSDSYAVIPNVHDMITFCEKFIKINGKMVVLSTLFDSFDSNINWIKRNIKYFSSVEFGTMMLRENLQNYIKQRINVDDNFDIDSCFKLIMHHNIPLTSHVMKTYIVIWTPNI